MGERAVRAQGGDDKMDVGVRAEKEEGVPWHLRRASCVIKIRMLHRATECGHTALLVVRMYQGILAIFSLSPDTSLISIFM